MATGFPSVGEAQQQTVNRLSRPPACFAMPLKQADDLRVLVRSQKMKADIAAILGEVDWRGDWEDLDRAAGTAEISEVTIPPGTRLAFFASRENGKPHALLDVLWTRGPIDAFAFEFSSACVRYRLVAAKACSNFWIEELGKDTADLKCAPPAPPPPPVVSLTAAASACVTQPVDITVTVQNPPADGKVALIVAGRELATGTLSAGSYSTRWPGAPTPGRYQIRAVSGGQSATGVVEVMPCAPTCSMTVTPTPVRAGEPFVIDLSGSRVAAGVTGEIDTARVEVVSSDGLVAASFDMVRGNLTRELVIGGRGVQTVRAIVTDVAGQSSTSNCTLQVDVKGSATGTGKAAVKVGPPKPVFPWPPPQWTSRTEVPLTLLLPTGGPTRATYGDAVDRITKALRRGKIDSWSVYELPGNGFAVVAEMEHIYDDGSPAPGKARWLLNSEPPLRWSLDDLIKRLFSAPQGRYRVIALVVTTLSVVADHGKDPGEIQPLPPAGPTNLPPESRAAPLSVVERPPTCAALVYEFKKRLGAGVPADASAKWLASGESGLTATEHLVRAGLWKREDLQ